MEGMKTAPPLILYRMPVSRFFIFCMLVFPGHLHYSFNAKFFIIYILLKCLKRNSHIVCATKKISKFATIFLQNSKTAHQQKLSCYISCSSLPKYHLGISAWGSACKTKLECLRKIQKRIVRTICASPKLLL